MADDIEIINRKEAKERGLKRYFTGKPCKYGHIAERQVSDKKCCECKAEYNREHRNQNKDKESERNSKYRNQNKDKIANRMKEYYNQNKDKMSEQNKEWHAKNKDKIAERKSGYNKEWYAKNKDKIADRKREYNKKNPAQIFIRSSLTRIFNNWKGGRKKMEKLHGYTFEQLVTRIEFQFKDGMSWDNRSEWHIDHRKPISRFLDQGVTDPKIINALSNLQPMWASENLSKGAKFEL